MRQGAPVGDRSTSQGRGLETLKDCIWDMKEGFRLMDASDATGVGTFRYSQGVHPVWLRRGAEVAALCGRTRRLLDEASK